MLNELRLLRGDGFKYSDKLFIKHPTLGEIVDLGEDKYNKIIGLFCNKPIDYLEDLEAAKIDYFTLSDYDVFLMSFGGDGSSFKEELCWLFGGEFQFKQYFNDKQEKFLYDLELDVMIDKVGFYRIQEYLRTINYLENKSQKNMGKMARRAEVEQRKFKREHNFNEGTELINLISGVCISGMFSFKEVWDLKVFQFYNSYYRIRKKDYYSNMMLGIYTGNIDGKKLDNPDDIDYFSNIKLGG